MPRSCARLFLVLLHLASACGERGSASAGALPSVAPQIEDAPLPASADASANGLTETPPTDTPPTDTPPTDTPPTETAVAIVDALGAAREAWLVPGEIVDLVPNATLIDAWPLPWSGAAELAWELGHVEEHGALVLRVNNEVIGVDLSAGPESPELAAIVRRHRGKLRLVVITSSTTALEPKVADAVIQLAGDEVVLLVAGPEVVDLHLLAELGPKLRGLFLLRGEFRGAAARADLEILPRFSRLTALAVSGPTARDIEIVARLAELRRLELILEHRDRQLEDADLERLARLERLEALTLRGARVSDTGLSHIGKLRRLRELYPGTISEAGLARLGEVPSLRRLVLHVNPIGEAGLVHVGRMKSLRSLDLADTRVDDDALVHLARLDALRELDLSHTAVSDAGMAHLAGLTELRALDLSFSKIGDAGLASLATLGELRDLELAGAPISDRGLAHLAALDRLISLDLGGTSIGDAGLSHIARLRGLRVLGLNGTKITDEGLAHLAALDLRELYLNDTAVGDAGLRRVARLANLRQLDLGGTRVRVEAVDRLTRERPSLEITLE